MTMIHSMNCQCYANLLALTDQLKMQCFLKQLLEKHQKDFKMLSSKAIFCHTDLMLEICSMLFYRKSEGKKLMATLNDITWCLE